VRLATRGKIGWQCGALLSPGLLDDVLAEERVQDRGDDLQLAAIVRALPRRRLR
jgi:hypothetical protein